MIPRRTLRVCRCVPPPPCFPTIYMCDHSVRTCTGTACCCLPCTASYVVGCQRGAPRPSLLLCLFAQPTYPVSLWAACCVLLCQSLLLTRSKHLRTHRRHGVTQGLCADSTPCCVLVQTRACVLIQHVARVCKTGPGFGVWRVSCWMINHNACLRNAAGGAATGTCISSVHDGGGGGRLAHAPSQVNRRWCLIPMGFP